jgi:hypothetical protein
MLYACNTNAHRVSLVYISWNSYKILYDYYMYVSGAVGGGDAGKCASVLLVLIRMDSIRVQYYNSLHRLYYALRTKYTSSLSYETWFVNSWFSSNPIPSDNALSCSLVCRLHLHREVQHEAIFELYLLFVYLFVDGLFKYAVRDSSVYEL